jgi:hypothetical protein
MASVMVMTAGEFEALRDLRSLAEATGVAVLATTTNTLREMHGTLPEKVERLTQDGTLAAGCVYDLVARHDDWCPAVRSKVGADCRCDPDLDVVIGGTGGIASADELLTRAAR